VGSNCDTKKEYVYSKDASGNYPTVPTTTISEGNIGGFGCSATLLGNHLVIGANGHLPKAFIYKKNSAGEFSAPKTSVINAYTLEHRFGQVVALSPTHLAVSAGSRPERWTAANKVFLFKKDAGGDIPIIATQVIDKYTLTASGGSSGFGNAMALSATHLVVGGRVNPSVDVYVFRMDSSGAFPTTATTIILGTDHKIFQGTSNEKVSYIFGLRLSLSDNHLAIAADGNINGRRVWLFSKNAAGDFPSKATSTINGYTGEDNFGSAIALSGTQLVVGANSAKAAFVFFKPSIPTKSGMIATSYGPGWNDWPLNAPVNPGVTTYTSAASPACRDFDGDGDVDCVIGRADGSLIYWESNGISSATGVGNLTNHNQAPLMPYGGNIGPVSGNCTGPFCAPLATPGMDFARDCQANATALISFGGVGGCKNPTRYAKTLWACCGGFVGDQTFARPTAVDIDNDGDIGVASLTRP